MTKSLLKISAACAASSMLAVSAWAQTADSDSQNKPMINQNQPSGNLRSEQNNQGWSTKHLSATGRMNEQAVRTSKLVGAQVNDSSGQRVGQIQDTIVDPVSGRIDFALLSLNTTGSSPNSTEDNNTSASASNEKLVPVPWSLLRTSASSEYSANSEQPLFTLNADRNKLNSAPTVDWSNLTQSQWRQRIYAYYGVTPQSSMGGAESPSGEIKGEGARKLQQGSPEQPVQPQPNP